MTAAVSVPGLHTMVHRKVVSSVNGLHEMLEEGISCNRAGYQRCRQTGMDIL